MNHSPSNWPRDVRMRGFKHRTEVEAVVKLLTDRLECLGSETIVSSAGAGRVLAADVVADCAVPGFVRAAMDGYALRGDETFGAGDYNPLTFDVVGEAYPGRAFDGSVGSGQAVRIMTGAPVPNGADAVLQAEATEVVDTQPDKVVIRDAVPPGKNVGQVGEDIAVGTTVLPAGRVLRPQDLGVLASIGVTSISVVKQPRVAILVTGDELLPCGSKPQGFRIVDSNSVMLRALVARDGGTPPRIQMIPDQYDQIRTALEQAGEDLILVSGGSSVGHEDFAPHVLSELGELPVHGVALRPASPTGVGFIGGRCVFLLPGNPVSCLCAYDLFAGRAVRRLAGRSIELPYRSWELPLGRKISSVVGRFDYVRVQVQGGQVEPLAVSGASILSSTTRADGFVLVDADSEGFAEGELVRVFFYDG